MHDDLHLTETRIDGERVYDGALLHINRDRVRLPDGTEAVREYVVHPGAVMIIPVLPDGRLLMERQFRYPLNRVFVEFPAGKLDPGEELLACARRELEEETGYTAAQWDYLGVTHPVISYATEEIHLFLARELTAGEAKLDDGEFVETVAMPLSTLLAGVLDGSITDAKTVAGIFWAQQKL